MLTELTDRAFWQRTAADADAAPLIAQVRTQHDDNAEKATSILRFGQRYRHYRDGTRASFEQPYFARRRFLTAAVLLALLYPDNPAYRDEAQDTIMAICEETCWALPAHTSGVPEEDAVCIDLFAAETGMMLAEIRYALGDRLDAVVRDRIAAEVGRRIRDNYRAHAYFLESCHHNWAAVCASNVGGALLYTDPQAFETALPRPERTFACFLDGFPDDGVCLEGMRYWQFGFGEYVWFAALLYRATAGETDLLATEKVRRIAAYGQNMLLCGGAAVSFSDSPPTAARIWLCSAICTGAFRRLWPGCRRNISLYGSVIAAGFSYPARCCTAGPTAERCAPPLSPATWIIPTADRPWCIGRATRWPRKPATTMSPITTMTSARSLWRPRGDRCCATPDLRRMWRSISTRAAATHFCTHRPRATASPSSTGRNRQPDGIAPVSCGGRDTRSVWRWPEPMPSPPCAR